MNSEKQTSRFEYLDIENIVLSGTNPRKFFDPNAIHDLAESIKVHGIIQPISVMEQDDSYSVICGERRFRAAKIANLDLVPAVVYKNLSSNTILEMQIIENLQRKDVHPMEEAAAIKQMIDNGMKAKDVAVKLGKTLAYVTQRLKFNDLIPAFQNLFFNGRITYSDAYKVARLLQEEQEELFDNKNDDIKRLDENETLEFDIWDFEEYEVDLKEAKFNIDDSTLIPKIGSCIGCQYNTANANLLFPEFDKQPHCTNVRCFNEKTELYKKNEINIALQKNIPFAINTYYVSDDNKNTLKYIEENNAKIYKRDDFEIIEEPNPALEFSEWKSEYGYDDEDGENEDEAIIADYAEYLDGCKKEKAQYEIDQKNAIRAILLFSKDNQVEGFIKIKEQKEIANGSNNSVLQKTNRIDEIADEKLIAKCKEIVKENIAVLTNSKVHEAAFWFLNNSWTTRELFCKNNDINVYMLKKELLQSFENLPEDVINEWKAEAMNEFFIKNAHSTKRAGGAVLLELAKQFDYTAVTNTEIELQEKADRQKAKLNNGK